MTIDADEIDELLESAALAEPGVVPFHGYAPEALAPTAWQPPLTLAISRQTGARGSSVAERVGELTGRTVYTQEAFDYMTAGLGMESTPADLDEDAAAWFRSHWEQARASDWLAADQALAPVVRTVLVLAAQGGGTIVGRGAGCMLPRPVRLFVRLTSPEERRVAFVAQWQRVTLEQARGYVRERDRRRAQFVRERFGRSADDLLHYDLVLDTSHFGVDGAARIIAAAVEQRERLRQG